MLEAQVAYGPHDQQLLSRDGFSVGRNLWRLLPEDAFDRQPIVGADGRFILVADVRLDSRLELQRKLGLSLPDCTTLSDAAVMMKVIERGGVAALDTLHGDFAYALWDTAERRLILGRDPTGQRPLHYFSDSRCFAFASMPQALWAVDGVPRSLDEQRMAGLIADFDPPPAETYYKSICRVPTGHVLSVTAEKKEVRRYWEPPLRTLQLPSDDDYVDAFKETLDRAVASRVRRMTGSVATHLSGGVDSGAVTATAAKLLLKEGGKVLAFTSAPPEGFDGNVPRARIADESSYASMTAAMHPNIEHLITRSGNISPLNLVDHRHVFAQYPVTQPSNGVWWSAINAQASDLGATILLTGQLGNFTISASGPSLLADLIGARQWRQWWAEAQMTVRKTPARWRGVLAASFGPWMPRFLWHGILRAFMGASPAGSGSKLLTPNWARLIDTRVNLGRDLVPERDSYELRLRLLQKFDPGAFRKGSLAQFGIDERDPTADRALIEFCLSLPHDQLLKNGVTRPLARKALADRLPSFLLGDPPRGYQKADWYKPLRQEDMRREVQEIERCPLAASIINTERLHEMVDDWPQGNWNSMRVVQEYRFGFLRAVSAGRFMKSISDRAAFNV